MVIICDIDGTIANIEHRLHYIHGEKKDWDSFYKACDKDDLNTPTFLILEDLKETDNRIIMLTGRPESYRKETIKWLEKYDVPYNHLLMRKHGDFRKDYIVKKELFETEIEKMYTNHLFLALEDRKQCVDMWRSIGITCWQVDTGEF